MCITLKGMLLWKENFVWEHSFLKVVDLFALEIKNVLQEIKNPI